ncbi:hypothetical protein RND81_05G153500 [Saponaria officinalis]|uniref:Uncharacterized protein n=1 Tax=Saponaria officinalis TaxID=3572 RepID=A0AAW1KW31_SAPOF
MYQARRYVGMILLIFIINCAIIRQAEGSEGSVKWHFCFWKCVFAKHREDCIDKCMGNGIYEKWNTCEPNCVNSACSPLAKQAHQGFAKFEECVNSCRSNCKKTF